MKQQGKFALAIVNAMVYALAALGLATAAGAARADETLTVFWTKGFYKSEDDALLNVVKKFEAKTGIKVELSQYAIQDMIPKTVAALDSGTVPDVAYSDTYDVQAQGKWAYEGKLEDLSDILVPMKSAFAPNLPLFLLLVFFAAMPVYSSNCPTCCSD